MIAAFSALAGWLRLIQIPVPSADSVPNTGGLTSLQSSLTPSGPDPLGVGTAVAAPLLTGFEVLIPAAVALAGLHKLMQHQETGGSFLVDMLVKGGGSILIIQLVKGVTGLV